MRILEVNIPEESAYNGLKNIKLQKLGQVVLMTGQNGAGKSRILYRISRQAENTISKKEIDGIKLRIHNEINGIETDRRTVNRFNQQINQSEDEMAIKTNRAKIQTFKNQIERRNRDIENFNKQLRESPFLTTTNPEDRPSIISFVPKTLELTDPSELSTNNIKSNSDNIDRLGIETISIGALSRIQRTQNTWFNCTHQHSNASDDQKRNAIDEYDRLRDLLSLFLGTDLERTDDGEATLFGFPIGKAQLSDGQKVLLQLSLAIYAQEARLRNVILFMDEPENHLHPKAVIEVLDKVVKCIPNGQIWIATHSLPILAHFDPSCIWFVENGKVDFAGKIPEKVLNRLLGGEEEQSKLKDFIGLPAQFATSRFAFECLLPPGVVMTAPEDDQSIQIKKTLSGLSANENIRVLDYGAGKGRIISNLADLDPEQNQEFLTKLDYIACDEYDSDKQECEKSIQRAYETAEKRYFNHVDDLLGHYDRQSFDVVIMCNVLHEIEPNKWTSLFNPDGKISQFLKPNGYLLLVEDHQLPTGEKAYQKGFLVLNTASIKELFCITEEDKNFTFQDARGDGRLMAHLIPSSCLTRITAASRIAALKSIRKSAEEKITTLRQGDISYKNGRIHGFWVQQFANAQLSLSELDG